MEYGSSWGIIIIAIVIIVDIVIVIIITIVIAMYHIHAPVKLDMASIGKLWR